MRRRRSACSAIVACTLAWLGAWAGCWRGPGGSGEAIACETSADCPGDSGCDAGWCVSHDMWATAVACRTGPACRDRGLCDADYALSLLGTNTAKRCVAVSDIACLTSTRCRTEGECWMSELREGCVLHSEDDCRRSEACSSEGRCAFTPVGCEARVDADCAKAPACATLEKCVARDGRCVRDWSAAPCSKVPPALDAPSWAVMGDADDPDLDKLFDRATPSGSDPETWLCRATDPGNFRALQIRVGAACPFGIGLRGVHRSLVFALPHMSLAPGDSVAMELSDSGFFSRDPPAYVKVVVGDARALAGQHDGASLDCRTLSRAAVSKLVTDALAATDFELGELRGERPDRELRPRYPPSLELVEERLSPAASLVGWDDPRITERLKRIDDLVRRWGIATFDAALARTGPVTKAVAEGRGMRVKVVGTVCGDALVARHRETYPDDRYARSAPKCALAISVRNESARSFAIRVDGWDAVSGELMLGFVHRAEVRVVVVNAVVVDARLASGAAARERELEIPSGAEASLLLDTAPAIDLGADPQNAGVLLRVDVGGPRYLLRLDAEQAN